MMRTKEMRNTAIAEFKRLGINMPNVDTLVERLSGGQRQSIACARAMMGSAPKVLMMDEPTAALGVRETAEVYGLMKRCRDEGAAVLLISHNMKEVFEVADKITVMRLGYTVEEVIAKETDPNYIVSLITGAIDPLGIEGR